MSVVTSLTHNEEIIGKFVAAHDAVFESMARHLERGDLEAQLKGDVRHTGFKRLTA
jgi:hypothetical protein